MSDILSKEVRVLTIIKKELTVARDKHGNERRMQIVADEGEIVIKDLIANEGVIITITHNSLIKRTNVPATARSGSVAANVIGMTTANCDQPEDDDFVEHLFTASTHDYLMFFTNTGRVYVERVHEIPDGSRASKGRSIANLLEMRPGEKVAALIRIESKKVSTGQRHDVDLRRLRAFRHAAGHGEEDVNSRTSPTTAKAASSPPASSKPTISSR